MSCLFVSVKTASSSIRVRKNKTDMMYTGKMIMSNFRNPPCKCNGMHHLFMSLALTFFLWKELISFLKNALAVDKQQQPQQRSFYCRVKMILWYSTPPPSQMIIITFIFRVYALEFNDLLKNHRMLSKLDFILSFSSFPVRFSSLEESLKSFFEIEWKDLQWKIYL